MKFIVSFLFLSAVLVSKAQHLVSRDAPEFQLELAIENYEAGNYPVAKHLLDEYLNVKETPKALYYRCVSALRGGFNSGARFYQSFKNKYPLHPLVDKAASQLGHYYFIREDWVSAHEAYDGLDIVSLDHPYQEQVLFERGFAALQLGLRAEARSAFREAYERNGIHRVASAYYLASLSWNENIEEARKLLLLSAQTSEWEVPSAIYLSKIYLETEDYDAVITQNPPLIQGDSSNEDRELLMGIAQAHYSKQNYAAASRYFNEALAIQKNATSAVRFMIGHTAYELGDTLTAIDQLKVAALDTGKVGQSSAFKLGEAYADQENYPFALNAYESAAQSQADSTLRSEARINAAKVRIYLQRYDEAIADLEKYLVDYPNANNLAEVNELLSIALFNTSNYERVLSHFENNLTSSTRIRANYQEVALLRAKQMISEDKYQEALTYLEKSLAYPEVATTEAEGWYWKGECHFTLEQYNKAYESYMRGIKIDPADPVFDYGLGYVAYNQRDYLSAKDYFDRFLRKAPNNHPFYVDAQLREADCAYTQKSYTEAMSAYREVLFKTTQKDFVYFQMGAIHQINGRTADAVGAYREVIAMSSSPYRNNAMIQSAQAYFEAGQIEQGVKELTTYLGDYPEGALHPTGRVKRALGYFNLGQYQKAKDDYLFVLDNYLSSTEAKDALLGLQDLQDRGISVDFSKYLEAYETQNPDDNDVVNIAFNQAKNTYYNGNYSLAITQMEDLLNKYPSNSFKDWIHYLLGDANQKMNRLDEALKYLQLVIDNPSSAYLTRALVKRGDLLAELSRYADALDNYDQLLRVASNQKEQYQAREGLMQTYYLQADYAAAIDYANQIRSSDWYPVNGDLKTYLVQGRCHLALEQVQEAYNAFEQASTASNEYGAEANYQMALIDYEKSRYDTSLDRLFDLNKQYGTYMKWVGRSFLLIADNYIALDEILQAKATLNSLIDHFDDPAIKAEARRKLESLRSVENELLNQGANQ